MFDWLINLWVDTSGAIYEGAVQPALYALGLMLWADRVQEWLDFALLGLVQIALVYAVCRPLEALHPGFLLTPERFAWLHGWIERHYPEDLRPADLADPHLLRRTRDALDELSRWMGVPALYPFQGASPP